MSVEFALTRRLSLGGARGTSEAESQGAAAGAAVVVSVLIREREREEERGGWNNRKTSQ